MAKALRTGRKSIPVHPVRVIHTKPQPTGTPLPRREPRRQKRPKPTYDEKVRKALAQLKRAAYNGDVEAIPELERKLDHIFR